MSNFFLKHKEREKKKFILFLVTDLTALVSCHEASVLRVGHPRPTHVCLLSARTLDLCGCALLKIFEKVEIRYQVSATAVATPDCVKPQLATFFWILSLYFTVQSFTSC